MPTSDDVYRKFGHAAEAAQLLETTLGNLLAVHGAAGAALSNSPTSDQARDPLHVVDRLALGQLLRSLKIPVESISRLEALLARAVAQRNRLMHSFYREHNFRINSDDGRVIMAKDLDSIHSTLLEAFKEVLRLTGTDLERISLKSLPTKHVPI
jgi:hypothetical protein